MKKTRIAELKDLELDVNTVLTSIIDDNLNEAIDMTEDPEKKALTHAYVNGLKEAQYVVFRCFEDLYNRLEMEMNAEDPHTQAVLRAISDANTDEVLDRLGSDYDEDGIPYWEKWHSSDKDIPND
jgi:hypothetical protein